MQQNWSPVIQLPKGFLEEDKKNKTEENPKNLRKLAQMFAWVAEQLGQQRKEEKQKKE